MNLARSSLYYNAKGKGAEWLKIVLTMPMWMEEKKLQPADWTKVLEEGGSGYGAR